MLLSLLVYSYATGTFGSRRIEPSTHDNVAVRLITAATPIPTEWTLVCLACDLGRLHTLAHQ